MMQPVHHADLGEMKLLGQAINLSRYQPRTGMPTPNSGEHTEEVLEGIGFNAAAIEDLRQRGII